MNLITDHSIPLTEQEHPRYLLSEDARVALNAALVTGRPLLVVGEPGVGKSQLALAAACALKRELASVVVDARTEAQDLRWSLDLVQRLADAHVNGGSRKRDLPLADYVRPGVLWWGFAPTSAARQHARFDGTEFQEGKAECPRVVLIDEIDKAPPDVPNGLLAALGERRIQPPRGEAIECEGGQPLVVVTSNGERDLPHAFVRRCLVLRLEFEEAEEALSRLVEAHLPSLTPGLLQHGVQALLADRKALRDKRWLRLPGKAELLDYLRGICELKLEPDSEEAKALRRATVGKYQVLAEQG